MSQGNRDDGEMREEYDIRGGVRGKYYRAHQDRRRRSRRRVHKAPRSDSPWAIARSFSLGRRPRRRASPSAAPPTLPPCRRFSRKRLRPQERRAPVDEGHIAVGGLRGGGQRQALHSWRWLVRHWPGPSHFGVALKVEVPWDMANRRHDMKLELEDADEQLHDVRIAGGELGVDGCGTTDGGQRHAGQEPGDAASMQHGADARSARCVTARIG